MATYSANAIPIVPVIYSSQIKYIASFRYAVLDFDLNEQITFRILLLDQDSQPLEVKTIELAGNDYAKWGKDDTYLINYISSKLGFSPMNIQEPNIHYCPINVTDVSNICFSLVKIQYDGSGNIILPTTYTRDASNNIIDANGVIVTYQLLSYDNEGNAIPYGSINVDGNNNPILPDGGFIDSKGFARNSLGQHVIMNSPM